MPYNVLAASPEQTFAQAVQQAQTTEADGFETAAPAEENLVTADAESTEKVTYTVTPGVSYGKGSIKLISGECKKCLLTDAQQRGGKGIKEIPATV